MKHIENANILKKDEHLPDLERPKLAFARRKRKENEGK